MNKIDFNTLSNNERELLLQQGWLPLSISYLKSYKKDDLIEQIRILEHNWAGAIWGNNLIRKRLENACDYLKQKGLTLEEINKIISVEGENV